MDCHSSVRTRRGEAKKIDEYVPKNIPAVSISAKYLVETGPKKKSARSTRITVREVQIDLTKDCSKLEPTTSLKFIFEPEDWPMFSRIRSKITIVSETESPRIVRTATTKRVSSSAP